MTPKNRWRMLLYAPLVAVVLFFLMHPYFRQMVFGPKIKGEPLWVWQQEFRARAGDDAPPGIWSKVCRFLGVSDRRATMVGSFPDNDEAMRPVLMSLIDDPSSLVRSGALSRLSWLKYSEETVEALRRATKDPHKDVRASAVFGLCRIADEAKFDLTCLRDLLNDPEELIQVQAGSTILKLVRDDEQAVAALTSVFDKSTIHHHRWTAIASLAENGSGSEPMFQRILDLSRNEPIERTRYSCVGLLGVFGRKALPAVSAFLDHPHEAARWQAINAAKGLKVEAAELVPKIVLLSTNDPDEWNRTAAVEALHAIDPKRFPKTPPANLEP